MMLSTKRKQSSECSSGVAKSYWGSWYYRRHHIAATAAWRWIIWVHPCKAHIMEHTWYRWRVSCREYINERSTTRICSEINAYTAHLTKRIYHYTIIIRLTMMFLLHPREKRKWNPPRRSRTLEAVTLSLVIIVIGSQYVASHTS